MKLKQSIFVQFEVTISRYTPQYEYIQRTMQKTTIVWSFGMTTQTQSAS